MEYTEEKSRIKGMWALGGIFMESTRLCLNGNWKDAQKSLKMQGRGRHIWYIRF